MVYFCPSTDKQYMSGVAPCNTVSEAMSWKMSSEENVVTPEDWEALLPLITES